MRTVAPSTANCSKRSNVKAALLTLASMANAKRNIVL